MFHVEQSKPMSTPISRKSLAVRCGGDMTPERIRKNERAWGLNAFRARTGNRSVLYRGAEAIQQLRKRGLC